MIFFSVIMRRILVLITCLIAASCNPRFQDRAVTQPGELIKSTSTSTMMEEQISTATLEPSSTAPMGLTNKPGPLPREEFTLDLEYLTDLEGLQSEEYLVLWDEDAHQVDLVTWEGIRIPLISLDKLQAVGLSDKYARPLPLPGGGGIIPISLFVTNDEQFVEYSELFYFIDLVTGDMRGLATQCETVSIEELASLGDRYFAFRCKDELERWNFFSLDGPVEMTSSVLPFEGNAFNYIPRWMTENVLEFTPRSLDIYPYYYLDLETGDQWSEEYPVWTGNTSPKWRVGRSA